jgi:hypothetical protein
MYELTDESRARLKALFDACTAEGTIVVDDQIFGQAPFAFKRPWWRRLINRLWPWGVA